MRTPPTVLAIALSHLSPGQWFGWASCGLLALTLLFVLGCLIATRVAKGWAKLTYVVIGAVGSWIGCGLGLIAGFVGLALQDVHNTPAAVGILLNMLAGGGPWVAFQIKKAQARRERMTS